MKKALSLMLVSLVIFTLCSCGNETQVQPDESKKTETGTTTSQIENTEQSQSETVSDVKPSIVGKWIMYKRNHSGDEEMEFLSDGTLVMRRYYNGEPNEAGTAKYFVESSTPDETLLFIEMPVSDEQTTDIGSDAAESVKVTKTFYVVTEEISVISDYSLKIDTLNKFKTKYSNNEIDYAFLGIISISDGVLWAFGPDEQVYFESESINTETQVDISGSWINYKGEYFRFDSDGTGEYVDNGDQLFKIRYLVNDNGYLNVYNSDDGEKFESGVYSITGNVMQSDDGYYWIKK